MNKTRQESLCRYNKSDKGKAARRKYFQTLKGKAAQKRYATSSKGKNAAKRYQQSKKGKVNLFRSKKRHFTAHPERFKARDAVNIAVKSGRLPRPDTLQCSYCSEQAEQYHHHKGYDPEHWLDVIPTCCQCHYKCNRRIA